MFVCLMSWVPFGPVLARWLAALVPLAAPFVRLGPLFVGRSRSPNRAPLGERASRYFCVAVCCLGFLLDPFWHVGALPWFPWCPLLQILSFLSLFGLLDVLLLTPWTAMAFQGCLFSWIVIGFAADLSQRVNKNPHIYRYIYMCGNYLTVYIHVHIYKSF